MTEPIRPVERWISRSFAVLILMICRQPLSCQQRVCAYAYRTLEREVDHAILWRVSCQPEQQQQRIQQQRKRWSTHARTLYIEQRQQKREHKRRTVAHQSYCIESLRAAACRDFCGRIAYSSFSSSSAHDDARELYVLSICPFDLVVIRY